MSQRIDMSCQEDGEEAQGLAHLEILKKVTGKHGGARRGAGKPKGEKMVSAK